MAPLFLLIAELFGAIQDPSGLPVFEGQGGSRGSGDDGPLFRRLRRTRRISPPRICPPADYMLTVEQPGFQRYRQSGITFRLADRTAIDVNLEVGQPTQSVEVTAAAAPAANRQRRSQPQRRREENRHAAAGRPQLHSAGDPLARRRAAQRPVPSAHQRQPPAHQRIHLRRHQRAAAGTGPGRLLSDHRRHGRIQAQRQRLLARVWPVQRRHCHGDRQIRQQSIPWQRCSSSSATKR